MAKKRPSAREKTREYRRKMDAQNIDWYYVFYVNGVEKYRHPVSGWYGPTTEAVAAFKAKFGDIFYSGEYEKHDVG